MKRIIKLFKIKFLNIIHNLKKINKKTNKFLFSDSLTDNPQMLNSFKLSLHKFIFIVIPLKHS